MRSSTGRTLCDLELEGIRDIHFQRLESLFAGKRPDRPFYLQGIRGEGVCDPYTRPEQWVEEALDSLAAQASLAKDEEVFRPLCLEFGAYNVHFTDRVFGARVYEVDGRWCTEPVKTGVGQLSVPDLATEGTWNLARAVAEAFISHKATVPLFGMPVIAGALTVAVNLYGENLLAAMLADETAVQRDLRIINDVTCEFYQWYFDHIPWPQLQQVQSCSRCMPPGCVSIYGCTTHLISAELYRDLVAPFDEEILSMSPSGGLIHLCGEHRQHIGTWREMKSLRAVQVNDRASEDLEHYFNGLRDDQVIYFEPTDTMPVRRALEMTKGKRIVIVSDGA